MKEKLWLAVGLLLILFGGWLGNQWNDLYQVHPHLILLPMVIVLLGTAILFNIDPRILRTIRLRK